MAAGIPPPPINSPSGSYYWLEWYTSLTNFLNGTNIPWSNLNFAGSNLTDILVRQHNDLQNIQGGLPNLRYHALGIGIVDAAGTGTNTHLPTSWTVSHTAAGIYTITHALALTDPTNFIFVGSLKGLIGGIEMTASSANTFTVQTYNAAGTAVDATWSFFVSQLP